MKIKICGLKEPENIAEVVSFSPDYIGFIFYEKSRRYVGDLDISSLNSIPDSIAKVGVFVNSPIEEVYDKAMKHHLDYVQLHGDESAEYCKQLHAKGIRIIKAFGIDNQFDFNKLREYTPYCDLFVFDTATPAFGGSGRLFDWELLKQYKLDTPFLLSGGLGLSELDQVKTVNHPQFFGVDLNSKLEDEAGVKNIDKTKQSIDIIKKI